MSPIYIYIYVSRNISIFSIELVYILCQHPWFLHYFSWIIIIPACILPQSWLSLPYISFVWHFSKVWHEVTFHDVVWHLWLYIVTLLSDVTSCDIHLWPQSQVWLLTIIFIIELAILWVSNLSPMLSTPFPTSYQVRRRLSRRIKTFLKKLFTKIKCFIVCFFKSLFFFFNTWTITWRLCSRILGTKSSNWYNTWGFKHIDYGQYGTCRHFIKV